MSDELSPEQYTILFGDPDADELTDNSIVAVESPDEYKSLGELFSEAEGVAEKVGVMLGVLLSLAALVGGLAIVIWLTVRLFSGVLGGDDSDLATASAQATTTSQAPETITTTSQAPETITTTSQAPETTSTAFTAATVQCGPREIEITEGERTADPAVLCADFEDELHARLLEQFLPEVASRSDQAGVWETVHVLGRAMCPIADAYGEDDLLYGEALSTVWTEAPATSRSLFDGSVLKFAAFAGQSEAAYCP